MFYEIAPMRGFTTIKDEMNRVMSLHRSPYVASEVAKLDEDEDRVDELAQLAEVHGFATRIFFTKSGSTD